MALGSVAMEWSVSHSTTIRPPQMISEVMWRLKACLALFSRRAVSGQLLCFSRSSCTIPVLSSSLCLAYPFLFNLQTCRQSFHRSLFALDLIPLVVSRRRRLIRSPRSPAHFAPLFWIITLPLPPLNLCSSKGRLYPSIGLPGHIALSLSDFTV
jgi:hypothetical protein